MARRDYTQVREGKLTCTHGFVRDCEKCRREIFALNGVKDGRGMRNGGAVSSRSLDQEEAVKYGCKGGAVLFTLFPARATERAREQGTGWTQQQQHEVNVWEYPTSAAETFHAAADAIGVTPEQLADIAIAWALRASQNGHLRSYVRSQLRKVLAG